ncbi:MAG TPA: NAD(P)-dependent oxidoreductase [Terriglobales bacterium]|jgi:nucleoside-diphosphate-sugar epimerase|nr:NAD(P)-dependent oxidoreductase [Terriglobales bacterium]
MNNPDLQQNPPADHTSMIAGLDDPILITGANGFIGSRVVETLLRHGFRNLRCFVRPSSNLKRLETAMATAEQARIEVVCGNLLSAADCTRAAKNVAVVYHLAAGIEKTFPGSFMNSVVTTRNLLNAVHEEGVLRRFVNISSFAVYSNRKIRRGGLLDENCELEPHAVRRAEAYTFAKLKQDALLRAFGEKHGIPYVIVRPGAVYGPGASQLTGRVGIGTFGVFLHLGGSNRIPLTYVDNCAEAIVLAGLKSGVDGEVFNVVDDELPSSRRFLRAYKKRGRRFRSIFVPYRVFYSFCWLWEKYSKWSEGQLPPVFNRDRCAAYWKGNRYSNQKLKDRLGWRPRVQFPEASERYFEYVRAKN